MSVRSLRDLLWHQEAKQKSYKESGIKSDDVPDIRKKLVFGECLSTEIKEAKAAQTHHYTEVVQRVASGRVITKYRMRTVLQESTGLNRKRLYAGKSVNKKIRSGLHEHRQQVIDSITTFLERDDNCYQENKMLWRVGNLKYRKEWWMTICITFSWNILPRQPRRFHEHVSIRQDQNT